MDGTNASGFTVIASQMITGLRTTSPFYPIPWGDPHDQSREKPAPILTTSTARSAALTNRPGTSKAPSRSTTADGGVEAVIATWQLRCLAEGCLARALDVPHQS